MSQTLALDQDQDLPFEEEVPLRAVDTLEEWAEEGKDARLGRFALLCLLHVPLGLLLSSSDTLSTAHALIVMCVGTAGVLGGASAGWVARIAAYIVGSDVLWRMTGSDVFDQLGKYGITWLFGLWMIKNRRFALSAGPVIYLLLLLPSIAIVVAHGGVRGDIRRTIAFNISGPVALAASVLFFRQLQLTRLEIIRILMAGAIPTVAILTIAAHSTLTADSIQFAGSNFVTSGGFGPNQVSAILSFGFICLLCLLILLRTGPLTKVLMATGAAAMAVQCALTFSRGGLYSAGGAIAAAVPFTLTSSKGAGRALFAVGGLTAAAILVFIPWLQDFTKGEFLKRINDTELSGRDKLMARDLELWKSNVFLGVGPGMSKLTPAKDAGASIAHTEFTRLIAEHGGLGALALAALFLMSLASLRSALPGVSRCLAACFTAWALLYMVHAAMRVAAPSLLFGISGGTVSLSARALLIARETSNSRSP